MFLVHSLKPRVALTRHPLNRLVHLILPSKGQILLNPILKIESGHQRQRNRQDQTQLTRPGHELTPRYSSQVFRKGKVTTEGETVATGGKV